MTTLSVDLGGVQSVEAAVAAVVDVLQDPGTAVEPTRLVAAEAAPLEPHDTGRLSASRRVVATAAGAELVYAAPYAVIVQARQPWLGEAITAAVPRIVALYETQAITAWGD